MSGLPWLAAAVVSGAAAFWLGWPIWQETRARQARDVNAERYLAWRGRAAPPSARRPSPSVTPGERARLIGAGVLGAAAVIGLLLFLGQA